MQTCKWLAVAILGAAALGAQAQGMYGEIGYSGLKAKVNGASPKPDALRAIVGVDYNDNLAFEGMVGFGLNDDSASNVAADLKSTYGLYVKPKVKLGERVELFGRAGWAHSKVAVASNTGFSGTRSSGDFAYGVGVGYQITNAMSVNADYMRYFNKSGLKVDGYTIGLGFRF
ncbi:porin family protein [Hydrogenophaga aquatica]